MKNRLIKFGYKLLSSRLNKKYHPFLVQLNITNRCNSRCNYCYAKYYERTSKDMPFEQLKTIIDSLAKSGTYRLNLVGGEPLLRKDIDMIIDHANRNGIGCAMTTNGILVSDKIEILKKLDTVCFSIDGDKKGNDLNRGEGSFDKSIKGLDECNRAKIKLQLSSVLTKNTVNDVDFMVSLAEKYKCKVGFTTLIGQLNDNKKQDNSLLAKEYDIRQALRHIIELKKTGKPILFSTKSYEYALSWPDYSKDIILGKKPDFDVIKCYAGRYFCLIDFNGDVYPCPQLIGIFKPGNVLVDGFDKAFEKASQHNCQTCSMPCSNEFSMFFGLKPKVLIGQFFEWCNYVFRK